MYKYSQFQNKKINKLKKFIQAAGITVHCYQAIFKDCKTDTAKVRYLYKFLEEHGIVKKPTLEKCKKLRIMNDTKKKIKQFDSKSIISEPHSTPGNNTQDLLIESEVPAFPNQKFCSSVKRIKAIVDSDSE